MVDENRGIDDRRRRSMLLTICGGLAFGLAGCSGRDSSNTSTPTPTLSPGSSGSGGDGGGGASGESDIPGEVVHNDLEGINVVSHRASGESVEMQIENTGDEVLSSPEQTSDPGPHIWIRTLTEEGTVVNIMNWQGRINLDNAGRVEPGVAETMSYDLKADQAARYEICLFNREERGEWVQDLRDLPWEEFCGDG
jgi:hypothetical protein